MRRYIGDKHEAVGFIEVPNGLYRLRTLSLWDIHYEDYSLFTPLSLTHLFSTSGFDIIAQEVILEGKLLTADINPCIGERGLHKEPVAEDAAAIRKDVDAFQQYFQAQTQLWKTRLDEWSGAGKKVVLWGAGSKETVFLNALKVSETDLNVVDINIASRGLYIAGSGHRIVSPTSLRSLHPEIIILLDPLYESEVHQLANSMDLAVEFVVGW